MLADAARKTLRLDLALPFCDLVYRGRGKVQYDFSLGAITIERLWLKGDADVAFDQRSRSLGKGDALGHLSDANIGVRQQ